MIFLLWFLGPALHGDINAHKLMFCLGADLDVSGEEGVNILLTVHQTAASQWHQNCGCLGKTDCLCFLKSTWRLPAWHFKDFLSGVGGVCVTVSFSTSPAAVTWRRGSPVCYWQQYMATHLESSTTPCISLHGDHNVFRRVQCLIVCHVFEFTLHMHDNIPFYFYHVNIWTPFPLY